MSQIRLCAEPDRSSHALLRALGDLLFKNIRIFDTKLAKYAKGRV